MVGWRLSRLFGFLFTCPIAAHFPKEGFSVFYTKNTSGSCEQKGSFVWTVLDAGRAGRSWLFPCLSAGGGGAEAWGQGG